MLESALERLWFDGRLVDVVLMFVMLEVLLVMLIRKLTGRGPVFAPFLCNLLAGVFLMLALREALGSQSVELILVWLLGAFASHLGDLYLRWNWQRPEAGT